MKKIFITTPSYDGKLTFPYTISLIQLCLMLAQEGIPCEVYLSEGCSLIPQERNNLVKKFRESDSTHMLCIDADLGFDATAVLQMLKMDEPFIAGVYPMRKAGDKEFCWNPVLLPDKKVVRHPDKPLLYAEWVPAGFMLIEKKVFDVVSENNPSLIMNDKEGNPDPNSMCFFSCGISDHVFYGEDVYFCRLIRKSGVDICVYPHIEFNHAGIKGSLVESLSTENFNAID